MAAPAGNYPELLTKTTLKNQPKPSSCEGETAIGDRNLAPPVATETRSPSANDPDSMDSRAFPKGST